MPRNTEPTVTFRPVVYATEEEAAAAHLSAQEALESLIRAIVRADVNQHYKELKETGRCRWMSFDPNVHWEKNDAEWAAWEAEQEQLRRDEKRQKRLNRNG